MGTNHFPLAQLVSVVLASHGKDLLLAPIIPGAMIKCMRVGKRAGDRKPAPTHSAYPVVLDHQITSRRAFR